MSGNETVRRVSIIPIVGAALLAVVIWGASPVATKIAVADTTPLAVVAIRTIGGGLLGLVLAWGLRLPMPASIRDALLVALAAFCGMIAFPTLFSMGMQFTSAIHGSMILACMPVITAAIAHSVDRRWPPTFWWIGCAVAIGGEAALVLRRQGGGDVQAMWQGDALVLASTLFACSGYVIGGNLQRRGYSARGITFWGSGMSACLLLPFSPWLLAGADPISWKTGTWVSLAYLAFGVTILGYVCWYWALGRGGVSRIGLLQFLQPISGLALSLIVLGERAGVEVIMYSSVILLGTMVATFASTPRT